MDLSTIIALAKDYAHQRTVLSERVSALEAEVQAAQRRRLPGIKSALANAADAKAVLEAAIATGPEHFVKPRTATHYGIKFGIKKGSGKIEFADESSVIARIKKFLKPKADALIKTEESLKKKALADLSGEELAKIGCTMQDTDDHVYVSGEDTAVDKLVARILKEGSGEEIEQAA